MMDLRVESWRLLHVQHTTEQDTPFLQFFHLGFPQNFIHFWIFRQKAKPFQIRQNHASVIRAV